MNTWVDWSYAGKTTEQRFLEKIRVEANGCWTWTAKKINTGYGRIVVQHKSLLAHRWSYEHFVGPIPDGFTIDHTCHNRDLTCPGGPTCRHRLCVNPDPAHLEAAPRRDNLLRGRGAAAVNARKTHCQDGHALSGDNLFITSGGHRGCRLCRRLKHQRPDIDIKCTKGHELTAENSFERRGYRVCRQCVSEGIKRGIAALIAAGGRWGPTPKPPPTHCGHGHEYTEANTYRDPHGKRGCRQCRADAVARYRERKREQKKSDAPTLANPRLPTFLGTTISGFDQP